MFGPSKTSLDSLPGLYVKNMFEMCHIRRSSGSLVQKCVADLAVMQYLSLEFVIDLATKISNIFIIKEI